MRRAVFAVVAVRLLTSATPGPQRVPQALLLPHRVLQPVPALVRREPPARLLQRHRGRLRRSGGRRAADGKLHRASSGAARGEACVARLGNGGARGRSFNGVAPAAVCKMAA